MHYIQTSSPLPLNTKPFKASHSSSNEGESEVLPDKNGKDTENNYDQGQKNKLTKQCPHTILVPLPYFTAPSRPPHTAPARFKQSYNRPRIYATRSSQQKQRSGALSSLSGWSSPSVINFNAYDLPQISRPVTRGCGTTGSIIGVQNKSHTGKVAIVAAVDTETIPPFTPPATAASEFYKQQLGITNDGAATTNEEGFSPEVDSISSEDIGHDIVNNNELKNEQKTNHNGITGSDIHTSAEQEQRDEAIEDLSNRISGVNVAVTLNVIDETGSVNDVDIYNPEDRDLQKQEEVNRHIQEAQENYQKRKQEIETLLDEHVNLVNEVNNLSQELQE
ncbi:uncharacterized protein LOC116288127 [Actinia tenebrosa]|uniref:Uncharacterized protein LOC116288127 n=1 Tax=Actinia tenebrosa TaxID=6105 RepID=A0A6P8H5I5_ACTTE|nr:uncharacterized protein LOC116288127 [Actinia tenebrosa]